MKLEDLKIGKIVKCDLLNPGTTQLIGRTVFVRIHSFYCKRPGNVIVKTIGDPVRTEEVEVRYLHEMPACPPTTPKPPRKRK